MNKYKKPEVSSLQQLENIPVDIKKISEEIKSSNAETQTCMEISCPSCPELILQKENLQSEVLLIKEELSDMDKLKEIIKDLNSALEEKDKHEALASTKVSYMEELNNVLTQKNSKLESKPAEQMQKNADLERQNSEIESAFSKYQADASDTIKYLSSKLDTEFTNVQACLNCVNNFIDGIYDDNLIKKNKRVVDLVSLSSLNESLRFVDNIIRRRVNKLKETIKSLNDVS